MSARSAESLRLFVFARHAESSANVQHVVSSDPAGSVGLTARGRPQARQLGAEAANLDIDLAFCTDLLRTQRTLEIALRGRRVPVVIDPGFDEIRAGDLDGQPIGDYWSWKKRHARSERLPHAESVEGALLRYADALRRLLSRTETVTLLGVHEFALRQIAEAGTTPSSPSSRVPIANGLPYLFDEHAIERAAAGLEASAQFDLAKRGAPSRTGIPIRVAHDSLLPEVQSPRQTSVDHSPTSRTASSNGPRAACSTASVAPPCGASSGREMPTIEATEEAKTTAAPVSARQLRAERPGQS